MGPAPTTCWGSPTAGTLCKGGSACEPVPENPGSAGGRRSDPGAGGGERLGLSQRTYAYYESGQRMVPPEVLCALGDLYGVSVDYLLGRTDRREMNR